jgi:prefoldin subunit 5
VGAPRRRTPARVWVSIALFVALAVAGAAAYAVLAPRSYRATTELQVTAVTDPRYRNLPAVLSGPSAIPDAIQLAKTATLAESVRQKLGLRETAAELLARVNTRRAGSSTVVDVTATASKPALAVQLANAFGDLLVAEQTAALNSQIIDATTRTFDRLVRLPPQAKAGAPGTALRERLATLRSLARSTNPSLHVLSHAVQAETVRPPLVPIVFGAFLGALVLGGAAGLLAVRRRSVDGGGAYDLAVTDRLVAQLEKRLADRIESLLAEQARLTAKETELAAREQALGAAAAPSAAPDFAPASELESRERSLGERLKVVTKRELELIRRAGELSRRERKLTARTDEAGAQAAELARRAEELDTQAEELETRAEKLETRAAELETRAEELGARAEELGARAEELARRADELEERTAAAAPPEPWPEPVAFAPAASNVATLPLRPGRWNLNELARVVEERSPEFPDRQDEWQSYLFFLRSYAEPDGTVPASFDWLIEEQFGEIVPASAS